MEWGNIYQHSTTSNIVHRPMTSNSTQSHPTSSSDIEQHPASSIVQHPSCNIQHPTAPNSITTAIKRLEKSDWTMVDGWIGVTYGCAAGRCCGRVISKSGVGVGDDIVNSCQPAHVMGSCGGNVEEQSMKIYGNEQLRMLNNRKWDMPVEYWNTGINPTFLGTPKPCENG